jgi:hypothetical protein
MPGLMVILIPARDNGHFAVFAFADALGRHLGVIAQRQVHDAPLKGGHRLQDDGPTCLDGLVGHALGQTAQHFFPARFVPLYIQHNIDAAL